MENTDKIIVLGDEDTVLGFRLAGVKEASVVTEKDADEKLQTAIANSQAGIIIATQEIMRALSPKTRKQLATLSKPVVIEIPGKRDQSEPGQSINEMVKKAIGVELK
jgi:V/A-type H+-transporting ATPase subunit F